MNNYERIKAMTINEMAEYFSENILPDRCKYCKFYEKCFNYDLECIGVLEQWLQAESEE